MMSRATIVLIPFQRDQCLIVLVNITSNWRISHLALATIHSWSRSSVARWVRKAFSPNEVRLFSFSLEKTDYYDKTYRYQNTYRATVRQSMANLIECQSKYRLPQNPNYPGWETTSCCHQHRCNHAKIHLPLASFIFLCPISTYLQIRAWSNTSKPPTSLFCVSRLDWFRLVSNAFIFDSEP